MPVWWEEGTRRTPIQPALGQRLTTLSCELVWATTWGDEANTAIAPLVGLPQLPVVRWPEATEEVDPDDKWFGLHWKTKSIVSWAQDRAFAWIDDEITDDDRAWVAANHRKPALLLGVDATRGITVADLDELEDWIDTRSS